MSSTLSPTFPSLHLRHNSFPNPYVALRKSQLILQPFFRFSYVIGSSLTSPGEPPMPRFQFCERKVLHNNLRNEYCSFTRDWIGAVASRCFPHTTLFLASEQTLKDLKHPRGTNDEVRRVDLVNWALRTSPKFISGVKYQFHQGFWPDQRSQSPFATQLHITN